MWCPQEDFESKRLHVNGIKKCWGLLWIKACLKWPEANWKTVLWTDESKLKLFFWETPCPAD